MKDQYKEIAETLLFDFGKAVLGKNAGGVIVKLLRQHGLHSARRLLVEAQTKQDPREWIGASLRDKFVTVQVGEVIKGWKWDGGKWSKVDEKTIDNPAPQG